MVIFVLYMKYSYMYPSGSKFPMGSLGLFPRQGRKLPVQTRPPWADNSALWHVSFSKSNSNRNNYVSPYLTRNSVVLGNFQSQQKCRYLLFLTSRTFERRNSIA